MSYSNFWTVYFSIFEIFDKKNIIVSDLWNLCAKNLSNINLYHILSSLASNYMKREFIFTWDNHPKTKEYLHLDFDAKVSFTEFEEWYEEEKVLLQFPIYIEIKNQNDVQFFCTIFHLCPADFWFENGKETFEAIDIVRVAILSWLSCFFGDKNKLNEISKILKWTVIKTYKDNISMEDIQELKGYESIYNYITYDVLNYDTSPEGNWRHKQNKNILNFDEDDFDEDINLFFTLLDSWWYDVEIKEDNYLLYVIYCVLFLKLDLYLTYIHSKSWFRITVVDEKQLQLHLNNWAYVLNISNVILSVYKWINIDWVKDYDSLSKVIEEQSWKKLLQDLKNDSKHKNKVSFTIDTKDNKPLFMSAKWKEEDMNKYKELEEIVWENWSIEKKRNCWKWSSLSVKKQHLYWKKSK